MTAENLAEEALESGLAEPGPETEADEAAPTADDWSTQGEAVLTPSAPTAAE